MQNRTPHGHTLYIESDQIEQVLKILKPLASEARLKILELLGNGVYNVTEISEALQLPASTTVLHIHALENAGLVKTELRPAARGLQKVCRRNYDGVVFEFTRHKPPPEQSYEVSMPVGAYVDFQVAPTCGLNSEDGIIGLFDDPRSFYEPDHIRAQLLWFRQGYVEYHFPNRVPPNAIVDSLQLSLEICSEAPRSHPDWLSDITLWINGREIGAWTSPADFGGERGLLTPPWWDERDSQYGLLKVWKVDDAGSYVDGFQISGVNLGNLDLIAHDHIAVRIGVKAEARNVGGLNIFGRKFGNYPQDILLRVQYRYPN